MRFLILIVTATIFLMSSCKSTEQAQKSNYEYDDIYFTSSDTDFPEKPTFENTNPSESDEYYDPTAVRNSRINNNYSYNGMGNQFNDPLLSPFNQYNSFNYDPVISFYYSSTYCSPFYRGSSFDYMNSFYRYPNSYYYPYWNRPNVYWHSYYNTGYFTNPYYHPYYRPLYVRDNGRFTPPIIRQRTSSNTNFIRPGYTPDKNPAIRTINGRQNNRRGSISRGTRNTNVRRSARPARPSFNQTRSTATPNNTRQTQTRTNNYSAPRRTQTTRSNNTYQNNSNNRSTRTYNRTNQNTRSNSNNYRRPANTNRSYTPVRSNTTFQNSRSTGTRGGNTRSTTSPQMRRR